MIDLASLAVLARDHAGDLHQPVAPLQIGSRTYDTDSRPVLMGVVNLSRDSTYRESVAVSVESALRKARVAIAQGADCVDIGAESSTAAAARVSVQDQIASLVPVVRALADEDIAVSVEGYDPEVVEAGLDAGARIVNLTGAAHDKEMFDLIAEYRATLVLCQVDGANVREVTDADRGHDPIPGMIEHFAQRLAVVVMQRGAQDAAGAGVARLQAAMHVQHDSVGRACCAPTKSPGSEPQPSPSQASTPDRPDSPLRRQFWPVEW